MRLVQRVDYILLPFIFLIFSLTGWVTYEALYQQSRNDVIRSMERAIVSSEQDINLELRSARAALSEILNSTELINYIISDNPEYQAYTFEERIYATLQRSQEHSPGLETLQLLSPAGDLMISAGDEDPFAEPSIFPLPNNMLRDYLSLSGSSSNLQVSELIYQTDAGAIKFALLQPFSPHTDINSQYRSISEPLYTALLITRVNAFQRIRQQITEGLDENFTMVISPADPSISRTFKSSTLDAQDNMTFSLYNPLFQLDLFIPITQVTERLQTMQLQIIAAVLTLTLVSFFTLRLLINYQIVNPVNLLAQQVRTFRDNDEVPIMRLARTDEVGELNNAYQDLLQDVQHLASYDHLTGLANRRSFQHVLQRQLQDANTHQRKMALLFIDLDNFKRVNDTYGHATGDRLLLRFAERLQSCTRPTDLSASVGGDRLARLAGDEFALLLTDMSDPKGAHLVSQRILDLFDSGFEVDGIKHNVHASIGIAMMPEDGDDAETLLSHADAAMYQAKNQGKNGYQFFNHDIAGRLKEQQHIEQLLIEALDNKTFELAFMPIYDAQSLQPVGAEILLRCPTLAQENIGPDQFIPVAETTGLIKQIDLRVIDEALGKLKLLQQEFDYEGQFAINISTVELHNESFPEQVKQLLEKHSIDPQCVELEITETNLASNDTSGIKILQQIKALGIGLSLDDFGTGYTAFNQLANFPVDCLKIDRSFVNDLFSTTNQKQPMVDIILALAKLYDLRVVAEGVENASQLTYLRNQGCHQVQGYFLSKPMPWEAMKTLARESIKS